MQRVDPCRPLALPLLGFVSLPFVQPDLTPWRSHSACPCFDPISRVPLSLCRRRVPTPRARAHSLARPPPRHTTISPLNQPANRHAIAAYAQPCSRSRCNRDGSSSQTSPDTSVARSSSQAHNLPCHYKLAAASVRSIPCAAQAPARPPQPPPVRFRPVRFRPVRFPPVRFPQRVELEQIWVMARLTIRRDLV